MIKELYLILICFLVSCLFACSNKEENEHQPLTIDNYCEVALGDTVSLPVTGGSGQLIVEGNDFVETLFSTSQNGKQQKVSLIGREQGETNIVVRDKITNESCNIAVQVVYPFLTLVFDFSEVANLDIPLSLFALISSKDSISYVFSYNNMQHKYNDIPIMKGTYHISEGGSILSFDLQGEDKEFRHTFRLKKHEAINLLNNMSKISIMPKATYTLDFTDVETGREFPYVFLSNKEVKSLPKRE